MNAKLETEPRPTPLGTRLRSREITDGDTEMLAMARHPFAVNPNPDLEKTARERGWTVYWPDKV